MTSTIWSGSGFSAMRSATATPPSASYIRSGSPCRAGSRTTSPSPGSGCISRCTRPWSARRASLSRFRSAPAICIAPRSTASPRTGGTRRPRAATGCRIRMRLLRSTIWPGCASSSTGSGRRPIPASSWNHCAMTSPSRRSSCSPLRVTSSPCPPDRPRWTSPMRCTPRSDTDVSGPGSTAGWSPWNASSKTA